MATGLDDLIARSLDADPALMPVLDYLLQDLDVLGGDPEQVVAMMRPLRMAGKLRLILDLGCGKGAIATALAAELGVHVTGIDAFSPFIEEARTRASAAGVGERCLFQAADMRHLVGRLPPFDAVLLIDCGPVFGGPRETAAALRSFVRPGGFLVVADPCRRPQPDEAAEVGQVLAPSHDAAVAGYTAFGDRILMEKHGVTVMTEGENERAAQALGKRAQELMSLYPGLHASMCDYIEAYRRDHSVSPGSVVPAVWIIQKSNEEAQD